MKSMFVILVAAVLFATPALAVEDAIPGQTRTAPVYTKSVHDMKRVPVVADVTTLRPIVFLFGGVRLGIFALAAPRELRHEAPAWFRYVFVDPIGWHRR